MKSIEKLLQKKITKYTKLNEKSPSKKYINKINKYNALLDEELEKEFTNAVGTIPKPQPVVNKPKQSEFVLQLEKELEELNKQEQQDVLSKIKSLNALIKKDNKTIKQQKKLAQLKIADINKFIFEDKSGIDMKPIKYIYKLKSHFNIEYKTTKPLKMGGQVDIYKPNAPVGVQDGNIEPLSQTVYKIYLSILKKYPQGAEIAIKFNLYVEDPETKETKYYNVVLHNPKSIADIVKTLNEKIRDKHLQGYLLPIVREVVFYSFGLNIKGGCSSGCYKSEQMTYCGNTIKLISPKSTNNNCLFMCFLKSLNLNGNKYNLNKLRTELNIPEGEIDIKYIDDIAKYFDCGYILLNQKQEIIKHRDLVNKPTVHILLMDNHYFIAKEHNLVQCALCKHKYYTSNEHKCNIDNVKYYNKQVLNKRNDNIVSNYVLLDKNVITPDTMVFFDLETFQDNNCHTPYACGWSVGKSQDINISYGKKCCESLIEYLKKESNKIVCAYNGSGFDFYILLNLLKDSGYDIHNIILSNGSILGFNFGNGHKVFDLYRFINSNLDGACKAYNIKNCKMKFDVLKIQSWELAEKYRNEVEPYLKYDVLSLSELFFTFNEFIYKMESVNITRFTTLSHMSYTLWQSTIEDVIELPDLEKYNFIKRATYGARCYPNRKNYKSKSYDDIISGNVKYDEVIKSGDYIFNADATSLYPASMAGFELLETVYPTGSSIWSDKPKEQYDNKKIGFYEIDYEPPRDIIVPILPRKTEVGGLEWSLYNGSGVFTNIDIKNAIDAGYKITFKNRCLVYSNSNNVFKKFIHKFYKMKEEAEIENNKVKRNIAKLLLNSMYGKTLQKAIFSQTQIINNYSELMKFFREHKITDISDLDENKILISGECLDKEKRITKPCQLGAFVLAYSRTVMLIYMKAIDPKLKTHIFTYTDTDSLHILGEHAEKLKKLGYIKDKSNSSLGFLCSDIDDEGIIINETNLAPKCYFYEYLDNKQSLHINENGTKKAKGIPKKCLNHTMYFEYDKKDIICEFSGLRRKHKNLTSKDRANNLNHFSIINSTQTRQFMKNDWKGMILKDNFYYPKGYKF